MEFAYKEPSTLARNKWSRSSSICLLTSVSVVSSYSLFTLSLLTLLLSLALSLLLFSAFVVGALVVTAVFTLLLLLLLLLHYIWLFIAAGIIGNTTSFTFLQLQLPPWLLCRWSSSLSLFFSHNAFMQCRKAVSFRTDVFSKLFAVHTTHTSK